MNLNDCIAVAILVEPDSEDAALQHMRVDIVCRTHGTSLHFFSRIQPHSTPKVNNAIRQMVFQEAYEKAAQTTNEPNCDCIRRALLWLA